VAELTQEIVGLAREAEARRRQPQVLPDGL
jgi:hypothetical protein